MLQHWHAQLCSRPVQLGATDSRRWMTLMIRQLQWHGHQARRQHRNTARLRVLVARVVPQGVELWEKRQWPRLHPRRMPRKGRGKSERTKLMSWSVPEKQRVAKNGNPWEEFRRAKQLHRCASAEVVLSFTSGRNSTRTQILILNVKEYMIKLQSYQFGRAFKTGGIQ